jgi:hypothetical protein
MVTWRWTLFTLEFPTGHDIIVIVNFLGGSFGPDDDELFLASSTVARREGIPRNLLFDNSGARFGIASDSGTCFRSVGSIHLTL